MGSSDEHRRAQNREAQRRYRERHPERVREANKKWRDDHAEYVRDRYKRWRTENPDKMEAARKRWVGEHPEHHRATKRAWLGKNRDAINELRRANYEKRSAALRETANAARAERKRVLVNLLGGQCADCGATPHPDALEFDHVGVKTSAISQLLARPSLWPQALDEAAKCELVCANCHRIRTSARRRAA